MDRENVIKGLECCSVPEGKCEECPYDSYDYISECTSALTLDAISMLKEQEAVEPEVEVLNEIDRLYRCPRCHKHFFYEKQKYCDQCGQEVKWE